LILTPSSPLNMSCLSSNPLLNGWQTPGVLQPSPLIGISPWDSVRKTFKGREACPPFSNISDSFMLLNFGVSERLIWSRHFLILALRSKFGLKNFLRWLPWSIVTLGGIQDGTTLRSRDTESTTENKLITHNLYFPSEYSMDHVNFALDCKLLKTTHYNGSMFIHEVRKAVLYQVAWVQLFIRNENVDGVSILWGCEKPSNQQTTSMPVITVHSFRWHSMDNYIMFHVWSSLSLMMTLYCLGSLSERWTW